jgi:dGTPase
LGQRLGADPDLCEAAAMAHDIGHPPYGHVGEEAIDTTMTDLGADPQWASTDHGGFEGNAQSFRLLTRRLRHSGQFRGLDLTRATLDATLKYPWQKGDPHAPGDSNRKFSFYPSESEDARWVRRGVAPDRVHSQSFEAQIVDWSDDVAYSIHDLEDWYRAGFMPLGLLTKVSQVRESFANAVIKRWTKKGEQPPADDAAELTKSHRDEPFTVGEVRDRVEGIFAREASAFVGFSQLPAGYDGSSQARAAVRTMRAFLFDTFVNQVRKADSRAAARRHRNDLMIDRRIRLLNLLIKEMLWVYVIADPRMATLQHGHRQLVQNLYRYYADAVKDDNLALFPRGIRDDIGSSRSSAEVLRLIADYVSGMTDAYATRMYQRLAGVQYRPFSDFV